MKHNPDVTYVEKDGDIWLSDEFTDSWGVIHIGADKVWGFNKGAGVHVAIIDTGIDKDHPDLEANIAGGVNFVSGRGRDKTADPDAWDDGHGHGTHCSGIVAADDNGFGVVGVAPDASLYGVKVLDDRGRGKASDFIAGLEWAVDGPNGVPGDEDDAEIISISLTMYDPIDGSVTAACDAAYAAGLLLVAAAGNTSGGCVTSPAGHPSVVAVSAIDASNEIAGFSADGPEVELTAPGVDIYSTYKNGDYTSMDGTSMSCPHVAGAAALAWATGYYVHGSALRFQLSRTAQPLGVSPIPNEQFGYGLVDALTAVDPPAPAYNVEVSEDNGSYLEGTTEEVILTVVLRDEFGNAVTNIDSVVFGVTLFDYFDPQVEIPREDFTIGIIDEGLYSVSFSISDLDVEEDVRYRVVVSASDSNRSGSGEDSFLIIAITGESLQVDIATDKPDSPVEPFYPIYVTGETIYITVTVKNENENPVEGARVYTRIITASGTHYNEEKYTDQNGVAEFDRKTKKPDGKGIWRISSIVYMTGYMDGWQCKYIEVR